MPHKISARKPAEINGRLIYVVGPSGSGKDSLLHYACSRLRQDADFVLAPRTITRPRGADDEAHAPVTQSAFDAMLAEGAFAMHWHANGFSYGIGREIRDWLATGRTVIVNGSRAYLPDALAAFPQIQVVHITAAPGALRKRLLGRGRESDERTAARLSRGATHALSEGAADFSISNDGSLEDAGERLLGFLLGR